ncbi:hypothetical protein GCM10020218_049910 [Dactylosporangium vinaceum]
MARVHIAKIRRRRRHLHWWFTWGARESCCKGCAVCWTVRFYGTTILPKQPETSGGRSLREICRNLWRRTAAPCTESAPRARVVAALAADAHGPSHRPRRRALQPEHFAVSIRASVNVALRRLKLSRV